MRYISFNAFDDLQNAFNTNPYGYSLESFRAAVSEQEDSDEHARVLFTANDGNDYAIVEAVGGEKFWFIGLTNSKGRLTGDLIAFSEHNSYRDAMSELLEMSVGDYAL